MVPVTELISDKTIECTFGNENFGRMSKRDVIRYSLLRCAAGYRTGYTAKRIMQELGLVNSRKWQLTKSGKEYLFAAFYDGNSI